MSVLGWQEGEPPRDGQSYVAMGRVVWSDEDGGESRPFVEEVHYAELDGGWAGWMDEWGLAIAVGLEERVCFDHWIALPGAAGEEGAK